MQLTVLIDNNTFIDQYYLGEPALSFYLEDGNSRILMDAGYSDAFLKNALALGVDLSTLTHIALSHGHNDHTRGLRWLFEAGHGRQATLVAHPDTLVPRTCDGLSIGSPLGLAEVQQHCQTLLAHGPVHITDRLVWLGEIPTTLDFEPRPHMGIFHEDAQQRPDQVLDDTALVWQGEEGLFIITGCSHSGICNIIEYAKKVCANNTVCGLMGGLHLFEVDARLHKTIAYLAELNLRHVYPCHCVSLAAKAAMLRHLPVVEVGVGLTLHLP